MMNSGYDVLEENLENKFLKSLLHTGVELMEWDIRMPTDCIDYIKVEANAYHKGAKYSFLEMMLEARGGAEPRLHIMDRHEEPPCSQPLALVPVELAAPPASELIGAHGAALARPRAATAMPAGVVARCVQYMLSE